MRADGTDRRSVTGPLDRGRRALTLTRDGWLYFTVASEGAVPLYRTRLDRIAPERVLDGPRGVLSFDVAGGDHRLGQMDPRPRATSTPRGRRPRRAAADRAQRLAARRRPRRRVRGDPLPVLRRARIQAWFIRPIGYQPARRYPPRRADPRRAARHVGSGRGQHVAGVPDARRRGLHGLLLQPARLRRLRRGDAAVDPPRLGHPPARDILIGADSLIARGSPTRSARSSRAAATPAT
jgi:hypothetical protein